MGDTAYLTKRVTFSAMHQLLCEHFTDEENEKVFGKCFRVHGHDYFIEVTIKGKIDPKSGLICDRDIFEDVLRNEITEKYNKSDLNKFFDNTTGENLAIHLYNLLIPKLKPIHLVCVRVQETPKNFFVYGSEEIYLEPQRIF
ncbi:MAG: 6-carboxytetrahydropterin synthase [Oligoflexia bacterium]|nr:6-carboxytetrahydropterin synthase [Oligoflexia bacterium]